MSLTPLPPSSNPSRASLQSHELATAPTPSWVWWAWVPVFGSAAIVFAGYQTRIKSWTAAGFVAFWASFLSIAVMYLPTVVGLVWLGQIAFAWLYRQEYILRTAPKGAYKPRDSQTAAKLAAIYGPSDINNISKDEMVSFLGIPIVYANVIEELREEGLCFNDLGELKDIAGIPGEYVDHLAPILTFGVRAQEILNYSWHRLNTSSVEELVIFGLETNVAQKMVRERTLNGAFKSVLDVKQRTGIPVNGFREII
jgi:DNA uptake protein ComE-like DNA-binding protein